MPAHSPDYSTLAAYIRNRLREGQVCTIVLHKRRVFMVPATAWGAELPEILVSLDKGASLLVTPKTVLGPVSFVAGGFPLTLSTTLARVFRVLSDTQINHNRVRKHNGTDPSPPAT